MDGIRKVLDISTGHLPEETAAAIDAGIFPKVPSFVNEYGWIFSVPELSEVESVLIGQGVKCNYFINLMIHAAENDCDMILFDRDGIFIADFPTFEW